MSAKAITLNVNSDTKKGYIYLSDLIPFQINFRATYGDRAGSVAVCHGRFTIKAFSYVISDSDPNGSFYLFVLICEFSCSALVRSYRFE